MLRVSSNEWIVASVRLTRRRFLALSALSLGGVGVLAACAPTPPPASPTVAPKTEAKPAETKPAPTAPPAAPTSPPAAPTQAAAAKPAPAQKAQQITRLIWGSTYMVNQLNPQMSTANTDQSVYSNVYDTPLRRDPDMKLLPGVATDWRAIDDRTWQCKLRPGVKFHNGDPLTAADIKFSIERTADRSARTLFTANFSMVERIDLVDDLTINFVTKATDPLLPGRLAYTGAHILPSKYFQEVGPEEFAKKPIGSGPFKVVEWVKDDHLTLEANKEYWGGAPNVEGIMLRPMPETASRLAALRSGDVNFIEEVAFDQIDEAKADPNVKLESVTLRSIYFLVINPKSPPLDNKLVRQALSLAIDRQSLVDGLLRGHGVVANGPIVQGDFAYQPELPPLPFDPQRARALLAQAGYSGQEILFETSPLLVVDRALAEAVVAMWKDVGVNAQIQMLEPAVRSEKIRLKSFEGIFSALFSSTLQDPDGLMWRTLQPGGTLDYWGDPEFHRLGQAAQNSLDQEARRQSYARMTEIMLDQMPWIILFQPKRLYGLHRSIQWRGGPGAMLDFRKENLVITG